RPLPTAQNLNLISTASMAAPRYRDEHNKVGYLQKPKGSDDYHQILDFLGASHISLSSVPADYVSAGHVLVPADRDRIC
ncbi:hypothetical protein Tco_0292459, partial [Tanacetum coccineum]